MLTVASKPIEKAIEKVSKKYEKQALQKVCSTVWGKQDVYTQWMLNAFDSGCMVNARAVFRSLAKSKKERDAVTDEWADGTSKRYTQTKDWCDGIAADYIKDGRIHESLMISVFRDLGCTDLNAKDFEKDEHE